MMRRSIRPRSRLPLIGTINTAHQSTDGVTPIELVGWPGFRTQSGHSGNDPVESIAEIGHMFGLLLHHLFAFTLVSSNILLLCFMAGVGLLSFLPLIITVTTVDLNSAGFVLSLGLSLVLATFGCLLIINLFVNLSSMSSRKK